MKVEIGLAGPTLRTFKLIEEHGINMRQALRQTFFFMGKDLKRNTRKDITDNSAKTGIVYFVRSKKGGRRRRHQSSAPGETHANLSGDLRDSLGWKVHGTDSLEFGYGVTKETTEYARRIEEGGTDIRGITIEARPSLKNNIKDVSFETFFEKALNKIARK